MEQGTVAAVIDADTIKVNLRGASETVRLIGVDAPQREVGCYGTEASAYTRRLLLGKTVAMERDGQTADRDRYGRLLRYVWVMPDGRDAAAEIIRNGYGLAYTAYPFERLDEYRALQAEAQALNTGLWGSACGLTEEEKQAILEFADRNDGRDADRLDGCCMVCKTGKACGDSCIARYKTCHQPPGCACDGG
jgi:endonuclease YncB( thermonuclease family)